MAASYLNIEYEDNDTSVSWQGTRYRDDQLFIDWLTSKVAERLDDAPGRDDFRGHLRGLELTGMGKDCLEKVLSAEVPEERAWAAGEALAEAILIESHQVVFPWNMARDSRNPFGSLPGADIVGFVPTGTTFRLALGEVKSSQEKKFPPQVMSGRSGHMGHQLDSLASSMTVIHQLLKWLHPRVKGTAHQDAFDVACAAYFNSMAKDAALFGVLIRDTGPDPLDLTVRGKALRKCLSTPTTCNLLAVYLPWPLDSLVEKIRKGSGT